jgi:excisionase family DNA binding protein
MQEQILITISLDEFKLLLRDVINDCLGYISAKKGESKIEIIDRTELCKRLAITEPTAIRWEKKKKIPAIRIGSSVRYNWHSVVNNLEKKIIELT